MTWTEAGSLHYDEELKVTVAQYAMENGVTANAFQDYTTVGL